MTCCSIKVCGQGVSNNSLMLFQCPACSASRLHHHDLRTLLIDQDLCLWPSALYLSHVESKFSSDRHRPGHRTLAGLSVHWLAFELCHQGYDQRYQRDTLLSPMNHRPPTCGPNQEFTDYVELKNQEKGGFRRFFFAKMYASLGCGALSAKCTVGSNILGSFLLP